MLHSLRQWLEGQYGAGREGASEPHDTLAWAASVTAAAKLEGGARKGDIIGKEAWEKGLTARDMCDDLHRHVLRWLQDPRPDPPSAWATARAVFLTKSKSLEIGAHRPVVPSAPLEACVSLGVLFGYEEILKPKWLSVEGLVRRGPADAHILVAQVVAEKASELGE